MRKLLTLELGLTFAFLYLPIVILIGLSFNRAGMPTAWTGFSLDWYGKLMASPKIIAATRNSLIVAASSTAIATVLGTMLALGIERRRASPQVDALLFAPMIIPDIVLAIALLSFFSMLDVTMGLHTIVAAHVVFNLAFVCSVVRARLKSFDWSIVEASRDLGASAATTFRRVTLPVILPAVIAGALLAFTLSVDEFIIAYFTAGAGSASTTLPMQIYAMIRFGVTPEINALAAVTLAVTILILVASQRLARSGEASA
jgi:spermidine/putrescine transport system permease protein